LKGEKLDTRWRRIRRSYGGTGSRALRDVGERNRDSRVLIVTSGGPIRAVEAHLRGIDQATARRMVETVPNCSLVDVVLRDGGWVRGPDRDIANPA
jgi:broad specificity phosphatase PhoE